MIIGAKYGWLEINGGGNSSYHVAASLTCTFAATEIIQPSQYMLMCNFATYQILYD